MVSEAILVYALGIEKVPDVATHEDIDLLLH